MIVSIGQISLVREFAAGKPITGSTESLRDPAAASNASSDMPRLTADGT
jgi:hypothetical protein